MERSRPPAPEGRESPSEAEWSRQPGAGERSAGGQSVAAAEIELVLRRAAELDRSGPERVEQALDLHEVERIGVEDGLSREAVQRAIAELRTGQLAVAAAPSLLDKLVGTARASSERLLPLPAAQVRERLHQLLRKELLQVEERHGDRVRWGVEAGLKATVQRALDWGSSRPGEKRRSNRRCASSEPRARCG